jgi:hypothetical protein
MTEISTQTLGELLDRLAVLEMKFERFQVGTTGKFLTLNNSLTELEEQRPPEGGDTEAQFQANLKQFHAKQQAKLKAGDSDD